MSKRLEIYAEEWVGREIEKLPEPILYLKLKTPGTRGAPDRIVIWNGGLMFIEFKREGEVPSTLQLIIHELLRGWGFTMEVHDNGPEALRSILHHVAESKKDFRTVADTDPGNGIHSQPNRDPYIP